MVVFWGEVGPPSVLGEGSKAGVWGGGIVGTDNTGGVNLRVVVQCKVQVTVLE